MMIWPKPPGRCLLRKTPRRAAMSRGSLPDWLDMRMMTILPLPPKPQAKVILA
jgi:hypothetical protein